jgi:hypothetical protein
MRASDSENRELFWGLRGGGGNFGIVTEFEFRLHACGTEAVAAEVFFALDDAAQALRGWRDLIASAPRQATYTAWVGESDAPLLPPEMRGRPLASVGFVWVGAPAAAESLLPSLRVLGRPVAERVEELTYLQLQRREDSIEGHALRRYWKGHYFRAFADEAVEAFLLRGTADGWGEGLAAVSLRAYGGAIADVSDAETAFSHRDAIVEFVAAARSTDPGEDESRIAAARRCAAALDPFASGAYVNVLIDEGAGAITRAHPPPQAHAPDCAQGRLRPRQRVSPQPEHRAERQRRAMTRSSADASPSGAVDKPLEQPAELAAVGRGERPEQRVLRGVDPLVQPLEGGRAARGQRDDVAAAVLLVAGAPDEAVALELVEDCVQVAAVDP